MRKLNEQENRVDNQTTQQEHTSKRNSCCDESYAKKNLPAEETIRRNWQHPRTKTTGKKTQTDRSRYRKNRLRSLPKVQTQSSPTGKADRKRLQHSHSLQHHL